MSNVTPPHPSLQGPPGAPAPCPCPSCPGKSCCDKGECEAERSCGGGLCSKGINLVIKGPPANSTTGCNATGCLATCPPRTTIIGGGCSCSGGIIKQTLVDTWRYWWGFAFVI